MESIAVEYKRSFGKETIVSLVAFANSSGGKVMIGINDDGTPCGMEIGSETVQRYFNEIKVSTYPQLLPKSRVETVDGKLILIFEVSEFPIKPVSCKNRYYKRVYNSNHLMTLEEIVSLQQESVSISFDSHKVNAQADAVDMDIVGRFFSQINHHGRFTLKDDPLVNLTKLKLFHDGRPVFAALLLFGSHDYSIRIGRFKSESTIIDELVIKSPLFLAVDESINFIKRHINLGYAFDGSRARFERWQYPLEAIRELLLNAIVHRDYNSTSDIVIKIFDDRIIFSNPGRIYGNLKIEDLKRDDYLSSIRNRLLAESFYLAGDIERYGTGFIRVRESLVPYPEIGFDVSEMGDYFLSSLKILPPITDSGDNFISSVEQRVTQKTTQKILDLLVKNPKLSQRALAELLVITEDGVKYNLAKLKRAGSIRRVGPDKGGLWEVLS